MAKVPNGEEILPKVSTARLGRTIVTDRETTDRRQTTDRRATAYHELRWNRLLDVDYAFTGMVCHS